MMLKHSISVLVNQCSLKHKKLKELLLMKSFKTIDFPLSPCMFKNINKTLNKLLSFIFVDLLLLLIVSEVITAADLHHSLGIGFAVDVDDGRSLGIKNVLFLHFLANFADPGLFRSFLHTHQTEMKNRYLDI